MSVSPAPGANTSGSMINPPWDKQAFDGRSAFGKIPVPYVSSLRVTYPKVLQPDQSLISTVSSANPQPSGAPRFLTDAAVLTAVGSAKSAGTFRPPYAGSSYKPYFTVAQLKKELLPNVAPSADMVP